MNLCLLLCLSFVPWSHCYAADKTHKKHTSQTQNSPPLNCEHMESLREAHERENFKTPRGDKFDNFDWRLSKELNAVEKGNIVISPVSLKVVLAMLYEGARGKTAQEIGESLDLHIHNSTLERRRETRERFSAILKSLQTSEGEYKIKMGTHAFIDKTAEPEHTYQCKLKTYYNSDIVQVDFSDTKKAMATINDWAKNATEGLIGELISEAEAQSSTVMLLLNAVYFKGQWAVPFPTNQTKSDIFHLDNQNTVKVTFMNVKDKFGYHDIPEIGAHMVELPYQGDKFAMYVLLPYNATGLEAVAKALGPDHSLRGIIGNMMPASINLFMPKFEFKFTTKMRSTLEKLGIKTMFSSSEAELVDIAKTTSGGLFVSNVLQKAGISVTEAGTVAFAASAVELSDKFGGSEEVIDFKVDRPFLFFIEDKTTKTTVFVGKMVNPDTAKVVSAPPTTGAQETETRFGEPSRPVPGPVEQTTRAKFNFLDGEILQEVSRAEKGNFVISPASIKTLLGLLLEAAEGSTLQELRGLLRLPTDQNQSWELMRSLHVVLEKMKTSQDIEVDSATNAYTAPNLQFNKTYIKSISDLYKAEVDNVDFKNPVNAANRINGWVSSKTRGKIRSLIDPEKIDPETVTLLVNTLYFNGNWKEDFQVTDTKDECFYSGPKLDCYKVPMMYKKDDMMYKYNKDFNSHIVQIPYKNEKFSMVLVVPVNRDGIQQMDRDISRLTFPALVDRARNTEVYLKLPRFNVEFGADLRFILTKMGLNNLFSDEAELPYMINNKQGKVAAVIHKAKIEVNEKGTKAAASTGISVVPLMSSNEAVFVTADHPFYFFIYEEDSKSVLFSGRISSLSGESTNVDDLPDDNLEALSNVFGEEPSYHNTAYSEPRPNEPRPIEPRPSVPQRFPARPPGTFRPTVTDGQYTAVENSPYNKGTSKPPSGAPPGPDAFQWPIDQDQEHAQHQTPTPNNTFLNNYKNRHSSQNKFDH